MSDHNLGDNFANLSDAEIQILHEIVQLAHAKPGPAFGPGLFAAYDEVIGRQDTTNAQSSKYFTFICRMLWGRKQHETVMERFVGLLKEAGITVEAYDDPEGSTEYTVHDEQGQQLQNSLERAGLGSREGRDRLLSSGETLAGEGEGPASLQKGSFAPQTNQLQDSTNTRPFRRRTRRSQSQDTHTRGIPGLDRGQMTGYGRLASYQLPARRRRRNGSVSSTRSLRISRTRGPGFGHGSAYSADESDSPEATQSRRHSISEAAPPISSSGLLDARSFLPAELFERSNEQLEAIAETFQETKDRTLQRRLMSRWNQKAIQAQAGHDQLILLSQNFDRSKLLKGAWSTLSSKLDERRLAREWEAKEVFYTSLEQTAVRERDSNLKWIAFSHWKVFAKENKERTSVARRHIMRKRYFQAWTNITALTDLKVRRFVLARFFRRWHDRAQQLRTGAEMATLRYETNLTKRMYLAWYWAFAERTAPEFHDRKLESKFFYLWRGRFNEVLDQDAQAEEHCAQSAEKSVFLPWVSKARELLDMSRAAEEFRKQRLLEPILKIWKKEAILAPRVAQVALRVNTRTRNDIFNKWHINTMQSRQATETDRQRVLRNAFTAWNDRVRTNFLQGQIDIRFKSEALYKWRLASRSNAAQLEHDRRLAHSALFHWLSKAQNRHRSIEGAEQTLEASQQRRTLQSAFSKLLSARQHQQDLEAEADNFRASRLVYGALAKWQQKSADVALLYRKADAAEFFILTTKLLKRWSHSTKEHQKYRKREAYSQIRRLCKMNMAREKLSRMQIQLAHVRNMEHCALEFQEDSAIKSTISTFRFWKHKAVAILAQERQAEKHYNEKLQAAALQKLVMRKNQMQEMTAQARELSAESAGVEAMNCLRRLDRRLFQIKGQEQWAKALREKHAEKHVKNMLRYWHEQTMASQRQRDAPRLDEDIFRASTTTAPALDDLTVFDHTAWNLESLELNLDTFANTAQGDVDATFMDDGIMTSTPMPGYLRTPSKRNTARAKARERLAANAPATITRTIRFADQVPATAPPRQQTISAPPVLQSPGPSITPFERKLREQGIASPSRTPKGTPGRRGGSSRFGNSVGAGRFGASMSGRGAFAGFEDIPEVSEDRSRGF